MSRSSHGPRSPRHAAVGAGLVITLALAATACTASSEEKPAPGGAALRLGDCGDLVAVEQAEMPPERLDRLSFACGVLDVPLDHADPSGERIGMAVVRVRSADQHDRIGSLVMNPGGPGSSGLDYIASWAGWLPEDLLARFDVVSFDPRGTGESAGITCGPQSGDDELNQYPDLLSSSGFAHESALDQEFASACLEAVGAERAPFFNTQDTARDLDLLRAALGDDELTYVGFSYGAKLGGEYARQFPDRVRALVLDAPSNPDTDPVETTVVQTAGFESSFVAWADGCPRRPTCQALGDPRQFVADLVARANDSAILSYRPGDDLPATGADVMSGVQALLYADDTWPALDEVLAETAGGDSGGLFGATDALFGRDPTDDDAAPDAADANFVINCNDRPPGPTEAQVKAAAASLVRDFPVFGAYMSATLFGCAYWSPERQVLPAPVAPRAPPIVVVGTLHDPATPYSGAVSFAERLGSGHLLTWEGEGHTAFGQSACVNEAVVDYLVSLVAPAAGARCPG